MTGHQGEGTSQNKSERVLTRLASIGIARGSLLWIDPGGTPFMQSIAQLASTAIAGLERDPLTGN